MYPGTGISIVEVANGFIVMLPQPMQFVGPEFQGGVISESELRRQAQIYNDEINGDPLLKEIQKKNEAPAKPNTEPVIPKMENVYIASTIEEALDFIKSKFTKTK